MRRRHSDTLWLTAGMLLPGALAWLVGSSVATARDPVPGFKGCAYRITSIQNINSGCGDKNYGVGDIICVGCEVIGAACPTYAGSGGIYEPSPGCKLGVQDLNEGTGCHSNCKEKKAGGGGPPIDPH
jgi:hypothetical protein